MTSPQSDDALLAEKVISLYQNLDSKYQVRAFYSVGVGHAVNIPEDLMAPDCRALIKFLNNNSFAATDFDMRSKINIVIYSKLKGEYIDAFAQDTLSYLPAFDSTALTEFLTKYTYNHETTQE